MSPIIPTPSVADDMRLTLDPFAHWPDAASAIAGLGGLGPRPDPVDAFHTGYRPFVPGPVEFTVRFAGLTATTGTLVIVIHRLAADDTQTVVKRVYVPFAGLAAAGGRYRLTYRVDDDCLYALHGQATYADAAADALVIDCDRRRDESPLASRVEAARHGIFGQASGRRMAALTVTGEATLAAPVSQMCTAAQMDDPIYHGWVRRMGESVHRHRKQWEFVYVAQALHHHGMLRPGNRGLGFGVGVEPLPATFAAMGVSSVATDLAADDARATAWSLTHQHGKAMDDLRRPAVCADGAFDAHVRFEPADMTAIPDHLRDFDFCWSSCAYEHLGSIAAGLRFVERSLDTLRPGGLAVHTTELNLTSNGPTVSRGGTVLFRRRDFERLALLLVARGHRVMPFNWDLGSEQDDRFVDVPPYSSDVHLKVAASRYVTTSFGIIIRKAG